MRKVNFAAIVNGKMPHIDAGACLFHVNYCNNIGQYTILICWTGVHLCGIIICTYYGESMPVRKPRAQSATSRRQLLARSATGRRCSTTTPPRTCPADSSLGSRPPQTAPVRSGLVVSAIDKRTTRSLPVAGRTPPPSNRSSSAPESIPAILRLLRTPPLSS
jgi:hypothetical protein